MTLTLLDGAVGTELTRRGFDTTLPLWSARPLAEHPEAVAAIHAEHVAAGCDVLTACTFRTHERSLAAAGWGGRGDQLNALAVRLAREAAARAGRRTLVAGSIAPLEDCYRPERVPDEGALEREHARQARSLALAGAELLLVETMNCRREAEAAARAAVATGLATWVSFVTNGSGLLLSGEPLDEAARAVEAAGAAAVLVNCIPLDRARDEVARLRAAVEVPVGAYPNVGHDPSGFRPELMVEPAELAAALLACRDAGAGILGGCCGSEPRHLRGLALALGRGPAD